MSDKEIRATIDTETVRGLQIINGGAAAALFAALPGIMKIPEYRPLSACMIVAIGCALFGLTAAVVHNRLRRKCSHAHEEIKTFSDRHPGYKHKVLIKLQSIPAEPKVCTRSVIWMWGSLIAFAAAGAAVTIGGITVFDRMPVSGDQCWELKEVPGGIRKFNKCTGDDEPYVTFSPFR